MPLPANVVDGRGHPVDAGPEQLFLERLFGALREEMGSNFERWTFVIHRWKFGERDERPIDLDEGGPDQVLVLLSDEKGVFPDRRFPRYAHVFRAYGAPSPADRWRPFPIGYHTATGLQDPIPFEKRSCPVFFSGNLNRNRLDLYRQFQPVRWLPLRNLKDGTIQEIVHRVVGKLYKERVFDDSCGPGSIIRFTAGFGQGFGPNEYASLLANTKIAICPGGFVSNETIRHWEAMRLGCVIISAPLPHIPFYDGSPIIQLSDWSKLQPLLHALRSDSVGLMQRHEAMVSWWHNVAGEAATARSMASHLLEPL